MGIDLGTSNSCVGIWNQEAQKVAFIYNNLGRSTIPSWVGFKDDGRIFVGESAKNQPTWIFDAKRIIGKSYQDEDVQAFI